MAATPARVSGRGRSQQPADTGVLLARIQAALVAGSASDFLALGTLKPDVPEVRAFLDRWFVAGTTAAELRERDRLPLAAARGSRSSSRLSWRPDPRDASPPGGSTSRRPTAAGRSRARPRSSVVEGLFRLSLSQGRQFKAHDLVVRAEDLELRLPDGHVFVAEAAGRITAAVLVGRGEMIFKPTPETEQRQIMLYAGHDELKTPFSSAFIRLSPGDSVSTLPAAALSPATADAKTFAKASAFFAEQLPKSFGVDLADLSRDSWSLVPAIGDFLAEVDTRKFGT